MTQTDSLQAVILAAGYARRMQPLSDDCHKALLSIDGETILGRIMESLGAIGVERVTVVTGYRADDIECFIRERYPQIDLTVVHNADYRTTNNIVSLSLAFSEMTFDADVLLVECDLIFDKSLMTRLVNREGLNIALVDHYRTGMDGTVVSIKDGYVSDVYPTDTQDADFSYEDKYKTLNIYRFDKSFCQGIFQPLLHTYANHIDSSSYYELVLAMLSNIRAHRITADVVAGERWAEVDDPNDLAVASFQFEPASRSEILERSFGGHWNFDVLDFTLMRNAYFPTPSMIANMRFALPELIASYGSTQRVLNEKLGYFLHCDPSHVEVLHGASQVFPILAHVLDGKSMTIPSATFGEYPRMFPNATIYDDAPGVDWQELSKQAPHFDVVVIVNPNTSTGTTLSTDDIYELSRATPKTFFWVDESFLAFSEQPSLLTRLESEPLENVAVLVSLSKSLGTPGLRLGYVYTTDSTFLSEIRREIPVWNLSSPAEFLLELLLKFTPAFESSLRRTAKDRETLREALLALPFVSRIPESGGNFLHVELLGPDPKIAARVRDLLLMDHKIAVKDISDRLSTISPRLRIAVRTGDENRKLITALQKLTI